jgi:hypothetical protein
VRRTQPGALKGKNDKDALHSMRLTATLETGDERYAWLNKAVVIASSARSGTQGMYIVTMEIWQAADSREPCSRVAQSCTMHMKSCRRLSMPFEPMPLLEVQLAFTHYVSFWEL